MGDDQKLNDIQVHDLLGDALQVLGDKEAATVRGDTALKTARRTLWLIQIGLLAAAEQDKDELPIFQKKD